jgi:hypothetical protein
MATKVIPIKKAQKKPQTRRPKPMPKREAQELVNKLALQDRVFIPDAQHAEERRQEREFTRSEIVEILREGVIQDEPVFKNGRWRYKLILTGFRRRIGAAVVTIIRDKEQDLLVVTVMWLDRR